MTGGPPNLRVPRVGPATERVLVFLTRHRDRAWTIAEIHRQTQCSRPTIRHLLQALEAVDRVDITGPGGRLSYQLKETPQPTNQEPGGGTSG